jgi:DNA-binding response OmpR family regulator
MNRRSILIIEDDNLLAEIIKKNLSDNYDCHIENDGLKGKYKATDGLHDLMIIDLSLPQLNGFEIVSSLRNAKIKTPVIVITTNVEIENEITTFKYGANIFHRKPLNFELLKFQISSLLNSSDNNVISIDDLQIHPSKNYATIAGKEIKLSPKEFTLLTTLLYARGNILNRNQLISRINERYIEIEDGTIDTLICRLRTKLGDPIGPQLIETVYGKGYRFNPMYVPQNLN